MRGRKSALSDYLDPDGIAFPKPAQIHRGGQPDHGTGRLLRRRIVLIKFQFGRQRVQFEQRFGRQRVQFGP